MSGLDLSREMAVGALLATGLTFGYLVARRVRDSGTLDRNKSAFSSDKEVKFPAQLQRDESPAVPVDGGVSLVEPLVDASDQLMLIFEMFGTPSKEEWSLLAELPVWQHNSFPHSDGLSWDEIATIIDPYLPKRVLTKVDGPALKLISRLLTYNPTKRITAKNALDHRFFADGDVDELLERS